MLFPHCPSIRFALHKEIISNEIVLLGTYPQRPVPRQLWPRPPLCARGVIVPFALSLRNMSFSLRNINGLMVLDVLSE